LSIGSTAREKKVEVASSNLNVATEERDLGRGGRKKSHNPGEGGCLEEFISCPTVPDQRVKGKKKAQNS